MVMVKAGSVMEDGEGMMVLENGRITRGSEEECFLFLFYGGGRARMLDDGRCWRW